MYMEEKINALWLLALGDYAILRIEINGEWIELMREPLDSPFSHIIEPAGIEIAINKYSIPK